MLTDGEEPDTSWKYRTWQQLDGYPYWGAVSTYGGGGYVASLGRTNAAAQAVISELVEHEYEPCDDYAFDSSFTPICRAMI